MDLAARARSIEPKTGRSSWAGYEYGRGYAVLSLPFDSGHLLGLRVLPENDFAPYVSVWHRSPEGDWAIHVDGPALETACPRYWEPVTESVGFASIEVQWTGPSDLQVSMDQPPLEWTLSMDAPPLLRWLNAVNAVLPLWTWRVDALRRVREWVARRYLGYGDSELAFTTASGQATVLLARRIYRIRTSTARLDGRSLGRPVTLESNPTIGDVPLPSAPSFVFGQVQAEIADPEEYERTRERVRGG